MKGDRAIIQCLQQGFAFSAWKSGGCHDNTSDSLPGTPGCISVDLGPQSGLLWEQGYGGIISRVDPLAKPWEDYGTDKRPAMEHTGLRA